MKYIKGVRVLVVVVSATSAACWGWELAGSGVAAVGISIALHVLLELVIAVTACSNAEWTFSRGATLALAVPLSMFAMVGLVTGHSWERNAGQKLAVLDQLQHMRQGQAEVLRVAYSQTQKAVAREDMREAVQQAEQHAGLRLSLMDKLGASKTEAIFSSARSLLPFVPTTDRAIPLYYSLIVLTLFCFYLHSSGAVEGATVTLESAPATREQEQCQERKTLPLIEERSELGAARSSNNPGRRSAPRSFEEVAQAVRSGAVKCSQRSIKEYASCSSEQALKWSKILKGQK